MNRVTSMIGPFLLGALAGMVGLEFGFYIIGIISSVIMLLIAWMMLRHPEIYEIEDKPIMAFSNPIYGGNKKVLK